MGLPSVVRHVRRGNGRQQDAHLVQIANRVLQTRHKHQRCPLGNRSGTPTRNRLEVSNLTLHESLHILVVRHVAREINLHTHTPRHSASVHRAGAWSAGHGMHAHAHAHARAATPQKRPGREGRWTAVAEVRSAGRGGAAGAVPQPCLPPVSLRRAVCSSECKRTRSPERIVLPMVPPPFGMMGSPRLRSAIRVSVCPAHAPPINEPANASRSASRALK